MKRVWVVAAVVAALAMVGAGNARADDPSLVTVGLDVYPLVGQNQPSSIGDFSGVVGYGLFTSDSGNGFEHFESDMRFMQGIARNPLTGTWRNGSWGLT